MALSEYDTRRRAEVLVEEFLRPHGIEGKDVLDVGCGLGFFSERLQTHGGRVTATDIGEGLLRRVSERTGCRCERVDALALSDHFGCSRFDIVLSSECIEHTPSPATALTEMIRVLRPGGLLAVSTPNWLWYPVVRAATILRLRPFDGYENFSSFRSIRRLLRSTGMEVLAQKGLHLFPFQLGLHGLSHRLDERLQALKSLMINLCVLARKPTVEHGTQPRGDR
jgi:2-polyprenyl-6-hydroxyphenyl methylase/3-demethylubiquinone-9 3-methyltransferase